MRALVDIVFNLFSRADSPGIKLPLARSVQLNDYSCAVHVVRSIFLYYGIESDEYTIEVMLGTDAEDGTNEEQIESLLQRAGLQVQTITNASTYDLHRAIDAGSPVIVSLDDDEHWGVVFGYASDLIYLMDPNPFVLRTRHDEDDFLERWDGWGLVVSV